MDFETYGLTPSTIKEGRGFDKSLETYGLTTSTINQGTTKLSAVSYYRACN
jgi:hypothetical protein